MKQEKTAYEKFLDMKNNIDFSHLDDDERARCEAMMDKIMYFDSPSEANEWLENKTLKRSPRND